MLLYKKNQEGYLSLIDCNIIFHKILICLETISNQTQKGWFKGAVCFDSLYM